MTREMFDKERASIREFGFVDPLTVRPIHAKGSAYDGHYQIIDGEHRERAGVEEGIDEFPCVVIDVDDGTAQQLTIVLNETRGTADTVKMSRLVQDLSEKYDRATIGQILPFSPERIAGMLGDRKQLDFSKLGKPRFGGGDQQVERVYRLPRSAAVIVDAAIEKAKADNDLEFAWQGLEVIATEFTS